MEFIKTGELFVKQSRLSLLTQLPLLAHKTLQRHNKAHLHEDSEKDTC